MGLLYKNLSCRRLEWSVGLKAFTVFVILFFLTFFQISTRCYGYDGFSVFGRDNNSATQRVFSYHPGDEMTPDNIPGGYDSSRGAVMSVGMSFGMVQWRADRGQMFGGEMTVGWDNGIGVGMNVVGFGGNVWDFGVNEEGYWSKDLGYRVHMRFLTVYASYETDIIAAKIGGVLLYEGLDDGYSILPLPSLYVRVGPVDELFMSAHVLDLGPELISILNAGIGRSFNNNAFQLWLGFTMKDGDTEGYYYLPAIRTDWRLIRGLRLNVNGYYHEKFSLLTIGIRKSFDL